MPDNLYPGLVYKYRKAVRKLVLTTAETYYRSFPSSFLGWYWVQNEYLFKEEAVNSEVFWGSYFTAMHIEGWENQAVLHRLWVLCFHQKVPRAFTIFCKNNKCWLNVHGDGLYLFPNRDYSEWQTSIHSVPCRIKWVQSHNVTFMCLKEHIEVSASPLRCHYASPVLKNISNLFGK